MTHPPALPGVDYILVVWFLTQIVVRQHKLASDSR